MPNNIQQNVYGYMALFVRQRGSHCIFEGFGKFVIVPYHNKGLRKGTLRQIIKQCGLTVEEFFGLL